MSQDASGLRAIAAKLNGGKMVCHYCGCPTAATIEHVHPRHHGGHSWLDNLVLACPYCNQRKSTREVEEFVASGDWKLAVPELPDTLSEMLRVNFGWDEGTGKVRTSSSNSQLEVREDRVAALVRPGKKYEWTRTLIGARDDPAVIAAAWVFLKRHHTPKTPKTYGPPKHVLAEHARKKRGRR
jgi:hypothetical protein